MLKADKFVRCQKIVEHGYFVCFLTAANAFSISCIRSSGSSKPTLSRMRLSVMPNCALISAGIDACVITDLFGLRKREKVSICEI